MNHQNCHLTILSWELFSVVWSDHSFLYSIIIFLLLQFFSKLILKFGFRDQTWVTNNWNIILVLFRRMGYQYLNLYLLMGCSDTAWITVFTAFTVFTAVSALINCVAALFKLPSIFEMTFIPFGIAVTLWKPTVTHLKIQIKIAVTDC